MSPLDHLRCRRALDAAISQELSIENHDLHDMQDRKTEDEPDGIGAVYEGVSISSIYDIS